MLSTGIFACQDCDDGTASAVNPDQDIIATFKIVSVLIPEAVDVDMDGQSSSNLVHESDCHETAFLTFNSDGTFRHRQAHIEVVNQTTDCDSRTIFGNWTRNGNTITAVPHPVGDALQFAFEPETGQMTRIHTAEYPRIDHETGNFETAQGNVTTIFEMD